MIKKLIRKILGVRSAEQTPREPVILKAKEHGIDRSLVSPNAIRVTQTLQEAGFQAFIVGGAVRDLLTGVKPKDFDIATNATPEQVKRLFRRAFIIGRRFQIVHVMFGQELLEVTTFRGASNGQVQKDAHGRVLSDNHFGEQHEDAARRDFTVNAMYYDPASETVLDYHNGISDIRRKTLRIITIRHQKPCWTTTTVSAISAVKPCASSGCRKHVTVKILCVCCASCALLRNCNSALINPPAHRLRSWHH